MDFYITHIPADKSFNEYYHLRIKSGRTINRSAHFDTAPELFSFLYALADKDTDRLFLQLGGGYKQAVPAGKSVYPMSWFGFDYNAPGPFIGELFHLLYLYEYALT